MKNPVKVLVVCGTGTISSFEPNKCIPLEKTDYIIKYISKNKKIEYTFMDIKPYINCTNYLNFDFLKKRVTQSLPKFGIIVLEYCPIASLIFKDSVYNMSNIFENINELLQNNGFLIIPQNTYNNNLDINFKNEIVNFNPVKLIKDINSGTMMQILQKIN